jgi:hypothetical protein
MNAIRKLFLGLGVALVAALWLSPAVAAPITIDDFTQPPNAAQGVNRNSAGVSTQTVMGLPTGNVAAGQRTIELTQTSAGGDTSLAVDPGGLSALKQGDAAASSDSRTTWDFLTGSGPIDLTNQTHILLNDVLIDIGQATFEVVVDGFSLGQQTILANQTPIDLLFPLAGIPNVGATNLIELFIDVPLGATGDTDVNVQDVITVEQIPGEGCCVPEPASLALWSLLGLGAAGYARRNWGKGRKVAA